MNEYERAKEGIADIDFCWNLCGEVAYECNKQVICPAFLGRKEERNLKKASQILSIRDIAILKDDQSMPQNPFLSQYLFHDIYAKAQRDIRGEGFQKVVQTEEQ